MNVRNWIFDRVFPNSLIETLLLKRLSGKGVALMYHEVLPDAKGPAAWTVVKESAFKEQMLFLKKYFDILTIEGALDRIHSSGHFDKPFAVVTFDDGYRGNLSCVLPVIKELNIPTHVFVSTHATETGEVYWYDTLISLFNYYGELEVSLRRYGLDFYRIKRGDNDKKNWAAMQKLLTALKTLAPQKRKEIVADVIDQVGEAPDALQMMNIPELQKLADSPLVTVGGHSHCHNILPQLSGRDLSDSLNTNRKKLMVWTGQKVEHFSYPNGDYDECVVGAVRQAGYKTAVTTQSKQWTKDVKPYKLPRYGVGRFDSLGLFIASLGQLV